MVIREFLLGRRSLRASQRSGAGDHPGFHRFVSDDPIGILGGDVNLYAFVGNAPLRFTDPFGLEKCSDTFGAVLRDPQK